MDGIVERLQEASLVATPPGSPEAEPRCVRFAAGVEGGARGVIPLASSYPMVNSLTPRARRRETLRLEGQRKKRENEERMARAKLNRAGNSENNPAAASAGNVCGATAGLGKKGAQAAAALAASSLGSPVITGRPLGGRRTRDGTLKSKTSGSSSGGAGAGKAADHSACEEAAQELQQGNAELSEANRALEEERERLLEDKQRLEVEVETAQAEASESGRLLDEAEAELAETAASAHAAKLSADAACHAAAQKLELQAAGIAQLTAQLAERERALCTAQAELSGKRAALAEREGELAESRARLARSEGSLSATGAELAQAQALVTQLRAEVAACEAAKKEMRNTILELKGNIRVFARVRPLLGAEAAGGASASCFRFPGDDPAKQALAVEGEPTEGFDGKKGAAKSWDFRFDRVFHPYEGQDAVFGEVAQVVQSALDGYRVCIFAYGQTGSGKTHTMEGDGADGIIPRSVELVFRSVEQRRREWDFELKVSFLEIYNESLRDLCAGGKELGEIRHAAKTAETTVQGLHEQLVSSPEETRVIMRAAQAARAVAATGCNERSSRSHSVFTLTVTGMHRATGDKMRGVINLVDLAGSERLAESKAEGQQLKETQAINKSLASLGDVIFALASKAQHVPYRNSKLTYLLQNSLGGNCKTLMLLNLSPTSPSESLCSLRFGHKVNSCDIGTAKTVKLQGASKPAIST